MSEPKEVKKLSLKVIAGLSRDIDAKAYFQELAKNNTEFAAISGDVSGHGGVKTQYGDGTFLLGEFVAINRQTGEVFEATKLYLPKDITETIKAKFDTRADLNDTIQFQIMVKVIEDKQSAVGYTYIIAPVRDAQAVNRRAVMLANLNALPAPKLIAAPAKKKA